MHSAAVERLDRFAVRAANRRIRSLKAQLARTRRSQDPEQVHDLRVNIRRLRACLGAFPTVFPRARTRALRKRLRRLFQLAGRVRDADIAMELDADAANAGAGSWAVRRELARKLRKRLRKSRRKRLLRRAEAVVRRPRTDRADARARAASDLEQGLAALATLGGQVMAAGAPPAELHRLRIRVKKLRYTLEAFAPLLPPAAGRRIKLLSGLQDDLGAIQDCEMTLSRLPPDAADARAPIEARGAELRRRLGEQWRQRFEDELGGRIGAATGLAEAT